MRASIVSSVFCLVVALGSGCVFEDECVVEGATRDATGRCVSPGGIDGGRFDGGQVDAGSLDAPMVDGDTHPTDAGPADLGARDAGCTPARAQALAAADNMIAATMCRGASHLGAAPYLNLGAGNGLFRFPLMADAVSAVTEGRVAAARLIIYRAPTCDPGTCPASAGSLVARPMRSDWDEGSDGTTISLPYGGCDWCRRSGGSANTAWGADGATLMGTDVGAPAGTAAFGADDTQVTVELDPTHFVDWLDSGRDLLSIQTVPESGVFVAASRESTGGQRAALELDVCP